MPKKLQKHLQVYLSKLKKSTPPQLPSLPNPITYSTSWILSGCKHPKTPSFSFDRGQNHPDGNGDAAATLTDIDRFLFENFNSLYFDNEKDYYCDDIYCKKEGDVNEENINGGFLFESPRLMDPPPIIRASRRFFVSSGTSSSLIEEARSSTTSTSDNRGSTSSTSVDESILSASDQVKSINLPEDSIAVLTYSPDPYEDFRRSMQEMIEARLCHHQTIDWDFMEELLFCFLKLNEKKSYKYILSAFVDLIVILRQNFGRFPAKSGKFRSSEKGEGVRKKM